MVWNAVASCCVQIIDSSDFYKMIPKNTGSKTDSKSVVLATVPRVQIPISPPYKIKPLEAKASRGFFVVRR